MDGPLKFKKFEISMVQNWYLQNSEQTKTPITNGRLILRHISSSNCWWQNWVLAPIPQQRYALHALHALLWSSRWTWQCQEQLLIFVGPRWTYFSSFELPQIHTNSNNGNVGLPTLPTVDYQLFQVSPPIVGSTNNEHVSLGMPQGLTHVQTTDIVKVQEGDMMCKFV